VASDRAGEDDTWARAYKQGFTNGRAKGVAAGRRAGLAAGIAQGTRQGREEGRQAGLAEGREQGAAEARRVPAGEPGQFLLVEVGDDGRFTDFVGDPIDGGGCFSVTESGDVRTYSSGNPFSPCTVLGGDGDG
jgi:hypothetical protein